MEAVSHPSQSPVPSRRIVPEKIQTPITISEAWKELYFGSPSRLTQPGSSPNASAGTGRDSFHARISSNAADDDDSSDDGALSDHSEQLHPETGFDPFLTATRRARQTSTPSDNLANSSTSLPLSTSSGASGSSLLSAAHADESRLHLGNVNDAKLNARQQDSRRWNASAKMWAKVVNEVMFDSKQQGRIDLSRKNLTEISPAIADLSRYVALPPPRYDADEQDSTKRSADLDNFFLQSKSGGLVRHDSHLAPFSAHQHNDAATLHRRTFSRSQSVFQPSTTNSRSHSFVRTTSVMSTMSSRSNGSYRDHRDHRDRQATLSLFIGFNQLTKLPSALFQLQNLRVLSLRSNRLQYLPPAIGDLQNLSELHVPNNELRYLPAEILRLRLEVFTWFPNPYLLKPPKKGLLTVRPVLCHKARRGRQEMLPKLSEVDETTPVKGFDSGDSDDEIHASSFQREPLQPPPLVRAPATSQTRQRHLDRTRSELQVEGFLARGIEQLGSSSFASIREQDDDEGDSVDADQSQSTVDATAPIPEAAPAASVSVAASAPAVAATAEEERQRILEAAFVEDGSSDTQFDTTITTEEGGSSRAQVAGRSRVLAPKEMSGLPSLQELCIRKLLEPYDVADGEAQGIASPFLSPMVHSAGGGLRRRRGSSRTSSRACTPQLGAQAQQARQTSFGSMASRIRSFSSNGGPDDSKLGKRVPTLLEAYENGTLQSLAGELSRNVVAMLEAARRSATQDWGTKARLRKTPLPRKGTLARTQSAPSATLPAAAEQGQDVAAFAASQAQTSADDHDDDDEAYDLFGGIEASGSLDRGDDACRNPWFSRCPNPRHCEERAALAASKPRLGGEGQIRADIALHRGKRGLGSTSSISSLGTTLGGDAASVSSTDMARDLSMSASSDGGRLSPISQSSSVGTVGAFGGEGSSNDSSQPHKPRATWSEDAPQVRFSGAPGRMTGGGQRAGTSSFSRSSSSNWTHLGGGTVGGAARGMTRPHSTAFVRGFSSSSVLSASDLRSHSFAAGIDSIGGPDAVERDWPLEEHEHRQAPIFYQPVETQLEWISHIGGIKVAKLNDTRVDLDQASAGTTHPSSDSVSDANGRPSMLGAMGGFENKDLIPILWRGCSRGCLDFLV
ncbi:hypothetical protein BCV70DRAFT_203336 [Testicularia cyperi]|uniref:L domain-like protein n=1 Tax=Testicularia cyperi TaxID=1882483 RepID=A0A317XG82_9BASI|nr:hypothetical protein BCV70DRAFT_203336 [Testicularia cyperi]